MANDNELALKSPYVPERRADPAGLAVANAHLVLLTAGAVALLWQFYMQRHFLHDDTLISLRFARNLVEHGVLEWNLGERVEGYTNFLHLLATALLMWTGVDPIVAVRAVNLTAAVGLLAATGWTLKRLAPPAAVGPMPMAVGLAMVMATAPFVVWVMGGLETVLAAALLTAGIGLLIAAAEEETVDFPRFMLAGSILGCAVLTRPDCAVAAGAALAATVLTGRRPFVARLGGPVVAGATLAAIVLAHMAWRYGYYGELLPNTFYAKVGVPAGLRVGGGVPYVLHALVFVPVLGLSLVAFLLSALERRLAPAMWTLFAAIVAHGFYVLWAGGDHMPASRLMLPVGGLAAVMVALAVGRLPAAARLAASVGAVALALGGAITTPGEHKDSAAFLGTLVGKHLDRTEPAGTLVALTTAGSTPYFAPRLRFIDVLGLVDHTIARRNPVPLYTKNQLIAGHSKGDGDYVLARRPDIIISGGASGLDISDPWGLTDYELNRNPEFHRCYRREVVLLPYDASYQRLNPTHPNPVSFIFYRRICPK